VSRHAPTHRRDDVVDLAELREERLDACLVADVEHLGCDAITRVQAPRSGSDLVRVRRADDDVRALGECSLGDGKADAGCAADDEDLLVREGRHGLWM
jgi:hypothetical protein